MHVYIETSDQRAPLFKDNNLTHSTANPVVADSSGKFPRTYATEGVYRIEIRAENGQILDTVQADLSTDEGSAKSWAAAAIDEAVADGLYSARHYATKANEAMNAALATKAGVAADKAATASALSGATAARAAAEVARDGAITAATAAGAKFFATTTAGIAGTVNGELFLVLTANGTSLYRNDGGAVTWLNVVGETIFDTVAAFLATATQFAVGAIIRIRCEMFTYQVAATTATDHMMLHPVSGQKLYVHAGPTGRLNVMAWGAKRDGVTDDTATIQGAINYCRANRCELICPGGPYKITTLFVECKIIGTHNDSFANKTTFTSAVGAGQYAIVIDDTGGALEMVTVKNTGAGNGIDCRLATKSTILRDVSAVTSHPLVTGSGSIGVNFGSDATPGHQAVTTVSDSVNARNYDIGFRMRYYSNSNVYRKLYALNTNNGTESSFGFLIDGRGSVYESCNTESRFRVGLRTTGISEENLFTAFWTEGSLGQGIELKGKGNLMINPYGSVGAANGSIPLSVDAYNKVMQNKGADVSESDFNGFSRNLIRNAGFTHGIGDLNWGSFVTTTGERINGMNALTLINPATTGTITVDHLMSYLDLNDHPWLRGKIVTMACFGRARPGVTLTLRGIVRTAGGSNLQYATSLALPSTGVGMAKVSFKIPDPAADARYMVFRLYASGVPTGGDGIAGQIACPMAFLGGDLHSMEPRPASDGENTYYGTQKIHGGGWNQAHLQMGPYHLWVDGTGDLRIKSTAPTSDMDGSVVGTQT
ncbi:hypothetical protein [uncultured Maritimibacter sp.]|jgi:hypothetical protein|uniref:hypothetical protein n=1 Tax=uncultured Maritimibacter sp. TaxID=991866 RepID=UPI002605B60D|nr:hypothetical protein [uncultured Maritimibacter sp.]